MIQGMAFTVQNIASNVCPLMVPDLTSAVFKMFLGKFCCDGTVYCAARLSLNQDATLIQIIFSN